MAITPISNLAKLKGNYYVNFSSGNQDTDSLQVYEPTDKSSNLKRVPVMVLIAMSPLNSSSIEPYNPYVIPNNIEMVQQTVKKGLVFERELKLNDQKLRILGYNKDDNDATFERINFNYYCNNNNKQGRMAGNFVAICDKPEANGKYLIAYKEIDKNGENSDYKLCYLPNLFGERMYVMATSVRNNDAIGVLPKSEFEEYFGKAKVANALSIKNAVREYTDK